MKIYKLGVVQVPTNALLVRKDQNDQVYKTKDGKWSAVAREIEQRHDNGQPVLVGTISVEVSELLGSMLTERGIKHSVLNAKPEHAAREGEIVADAGRLGGVTIATNMAGRGVDIKLGGNADHLARLEVAKLGLEPGDPDFDEQLKHVLPSVEAKVAEEHEQVLDAGGLFIIGTERHESRRIDNQLRGRAGRQGDPGESRFFLSGQDDLVRLFAGDRIYNILERFGTTDDDGHEEPIEAGILSKQIEKAQRKVEEQNFLIRKRVLEYDDVMNEQRRIVYEYRDQILEGRDMTDQAREEIGNVIDRLVDEYLIGDYVEDWDLDGMAIALADVYPVDFDAVDAEQMDRNELVDSLTEQAVAFYDQREQELGPELMRMLERYLLLQIIDNRWREHLYDMDYLREGIHLRGFAQIEPIIAYKNEAYTLFTDLMNTVWADFSRMIYHVEVEVEGDGGAAVPPPSRSAGGSSTRSANVTYSGGVGAAQPSALAAAAAGTGAGVAPEGYANAEGYADAEPIPVVEQRRVDEHDQVGRNDPCWCGSGKKFKKCHGT
ncbi:MAG: SEC-C metal-binding domain-containing protein, partial [Solirubrobacteraceae bacterium]